MDKGKRCNQKERERERESLAAGMRVSQCDGASCLLGLLKRSPIPSGTFEATVIHSTVP